MGRKLSVHVDDDVDPALVIGNDRAALVVVNFFGFPVGTKIL